VSAPLLERSLAPKPPSAEAFVRAALEEARAARALAVVRIPAPRASLDTPLRVLRKCTSVSWRPPEGPALAAVGRAAELELSGPDRFGALAASDAVFARMLRRTHPDAPEAAPRLFGGWAFAAGGAEVAPWEGFGDGRFVLPRWTYEHLSGGRAVLTLAVDMADGWAGRIRVVGEELASLLTALSAPPRAEPAPPTILRVDRPSRASWDALVRGITSAVSSGALTKAVASRRVEVRAERDVDPWAVLRRLSGRYPSTYRFGLRFGGGSFVGATPERLFEKRGRSVITDALAGSISVDAPDAERRLSASAKDQREHRPVVDHLLARLGPLAEAVEVPSEPVVRRLPNVLHLQTSVRATLRPGVHAADVAAALHPTPAVGGVPAAAAAAHIAASEAHARGWYCGPVGWIDADGNAELVVALRCGVLRGASAWLYAGGGIVEGSEPDAEWEETELKLRPLLEALGAP
jgi:isochorismate synthase